MQTGPYMAWHHGRHVSEKDFPSKILRRLVHKIQHKELDLSLHDWITEFIHPNTTGVRGQPAGGTKIRTLANHKQTAGQYAKKFT